MAWLRQLCLDAGADDLGFVMIERAELDDQRTDILMAVPQAQTLIHYVVRMNREPICSPARSIANLEFHYSGDHADEVGWESRNIETAPQSNLFSLLDGALVSLCVLQLSASSLNRPEAHCNNLIPGLAALRLEAY